MSFVLLYSRVCPLWNVCILCFILLHCVFLCIFAFFLIQQFCIETRRHVMCWDSASRAKQINFRHCQLADTRELFSKRPNPISSSAHHYFGIRIFNILLISAYGILIRGVTVDDLCCLATIHLCMLSRLVRLRWSWSCQENKTQWLTYEDIGLDTELSKSVWLVDSARFSCLARCQWQALSSAL